MNMIIHYSSKSNEHSTPQWLFDILNAEFKFTLDPCATPDNAKCSKFYTLADNGLEQDWSGESVFVNPPYGRSIPLWIEKAYKEKKAKVVCLVPARTDTAWFQDYCMKADEIRFIRGRVRFDDGKTPAPFPSCIVIFYPGRFSDVTDFNAWDIRGLQGK